MYRVLGFCCCCFFFRESAVICFTLTEWSCSIWPLWMIGLLWDNILVWGSFTEIRKIMVLLKKRIHKVTLVRFFNHIGLLSPARSGFILGKVLQWTLPVQSLKKESPLNFKGSGSLDCYFEFSNFFQFLFFTRSFTAFISRLTQREHLFIVCVCLTICQSNCPSHFKITDQIIMHSFWGQGNPRFLGS